MEVTFTVSKWDEKLIDDTRKDTRNVLFVDELVRYSHHQFL